MGEPQMVWCGRVDADQDVSIRLVPSGIRGGINQEHTRPRNRQTLAVVKVHSSRLRNCSKYFATALSKRWGKLNRNQASLEIVVEVHGEVATYTNCFSRMYTPFLMQFQDVDHSLKLLQVAVQIEYDDLMSSICGYLSSTKWSDEDEKTIRLFVASPLFPRSHAEDLVARLEVAGSVEGRRRKICHLIKQWIHSQHDYDDNSSARGFLKGLLKAADREKEKNISSTFENDVVAFINNEAKRMLVGLHEEYKSSGVIVDDVPDLFIHKLRAIHRVLQALVEADMGEEGVKCFLGLDSYPKLLRTASASSAAMDFAYLIIVMCEQVVVGNLVLEIPDRVTLLKNWPCSVFENLEDFVNYDGMLEYIEAAQGLFYTLPFKQQMELLNNNDLPSESFITPSALAELLSNQWSGEDQDVNMQAAWME